ncbi:heparinase II/III domain-containing protein [Vreelandella janggokensis]|uniref:Heparinase II/III-family protein n=1 Tax=Vreelandella janggokensis TaxID=370767 RepID=A0ABT4IQL4_9GAMM|nr:heparinase II/III family protein [Halomonas janggokensis]MCZ0925745.1 heparinase II/III-family protein [Halomonas janggokensis]
MFLRCFNFRLFLIFISALFLFLILIFVVFLFFPHEREGLDTLEKYQSKVTKEDINLYRSQNYRGLKEIGFQPRDDVEPWPFSVPVNWAADPYDDSNWKFQLNAWRGIDPIIIEYERTNNPVYLEEAISFMVDWYRHKEENGDNRYTWYDMAAGIRAMRIGYIIDQIYSGAIEVEPDEDITIAAMANEHAKRLQEEDYINMGNHGLFQVFGLDILCSVISHKPTCEKGERFASRMFSKILNHGFTEEGVHKEHSPYYHYFTVVNIDRLDHKRLENENAEELLSRAREVQPWLIWPNGDFVQTGDSTGQQPTLSSSKVPSHCLPSDECFAVGDFTDSGYAIIRSFPDQPQQESMLFVTGMKYSNIHKHTDELSFAVFEYGRPVFIDSGKYGYKDDEWREYVISAAAHNTISLNDTPIDPKDLQANGSFLDPIKLGKDEFQIEGKIEREGLFIQNRNIEYTPGERLVIRDVLEADSQKDYVSSLHLSSDLEASITGNGFVIDMGDGRNVTGRLEEDDCEVTRDRGQRDPALGWESTGYLQMIPTTTIRALCSGADRTITWNIEFN